MRLTALQSTLHRPVMSKQVMEFLSPQSSEIIVDCTVGGGGHATEVCKFLGPQGRFIGIDQDNNTLDRARRTLEEFDSKVTLICDNFKNLSQVLDNLGIELIDGILFDLGVSSFQLDNAGRGFSFLREGPLDMRMDQSQGMTAGDMVNNLSAEELARIIFEYGQERWSRRIARGIVYRREKEVIRTTADLAEIVLKSLPAKRKRSRIHPATRTFQGLRIAVNNELEVLKLALEEALSCLAPAGRIVVISFHSLEDRIVKNIFRDNKQEGKLDILTKRPVCPDDQEIKINPRARSAKLRAARCIGKR